MLVNRGKTACTIGMRSSDLVRQRTLIVMRFCVLLHVAASLLTASPFPVIDKSVTSSGRRSSGYYYCSSSPNNKEVVA